MSWQLRSGLRAGADRRALVVTLCTAAAAVLAGSIAEAQTPFFYLWGPRDGMVQYSVSSITQDEHGYIWLGHESGASRFNGRSFEALTAASGFTNEAAFSILPRPGRILLSTESGDVYSATDVRTEKLAGIGGAVSLMPDPAGGEPYLLTNTALTRLGTSTTLPLPPGVAPVPDRRPPWAVVDGTLTFALNNAILRVDDTGLALVTRLTGEIRALLAGPNGSLEVALSDRLIAIDQTGKEVRTLWSPPPSLRVTCGTAARGRRVLGTTTGALVTVWDNGRSEVVARGLPANAVMATFIDREDNVWAGLDSGGLVLLPRTLFTSFTAADGVGTGDAFYIVRDRLRGGVWIGTRNGGIAHILGSKVRPLTDRHGLPSAQVRALYQASDGELWIGTFGGIAVLDTRDRLSRLSAPCGAQFRFFYETTGGDLFAGSQDGALVRINGRRLECLDTSNVPKPATFTAMIDYQGTRLVGTSAGIFTLEASGRVGANPAAVGAIIRSFAIDGEGALWAVSRNKGAWRLFRGQWRQYGPEDSFDQMMRYVEIGPNGMPWFCSELGVWSFADAARTRLTSRSGLASDNIYLMRFDPHGQLWVGSDRGLNLVRDGKVVAAFDYRDGLADNELNTNGFEVDDSGHLWFCTMRGASRLDPLTLERKSVAPLLDLGLVEINDEPVELEHTGDRFAPLVLTHDRSSLRLHFSGQSFRNPQQVKYTYMLEGFDDRWARPSVVELATYTKVPPGRYTFRIRCTSADGLSSPVLSLPIEVVPAFWQLTAFRIVLVFLGFGGVIGLLFWRNWRIRVHNIELTRTVDERTHALATANEELRRVAITDPLTGIYNRRFYEEDVGKTLASTLRAFTNSKREERAAIDNCHLGFFMLDLDHFKEVNDNYGHEAGDTILRQFAGVVRNVIRSSDTLFRWGGEEFLVLARNTNPSAARTLAERLRAAVAERRFDIGGTWVGVTCSIGFVTYPFLENDPTALADAELVEIADHALYLAKQAGRDCFVGVRALPATLAEDELALLRSDLVIAQKCGLVEMIADRKLSFSASPTG
jgi:diguanylate cyclase (GGDEF)-like protein